MAQPASRKAQRALSGFKKFLRGAFTVEYATLQNGLKMPMLGYGTIGEEEIAAAVSRLAAAWKE